MSREKVIIFVIKAQKRIDIPFSNNTMKYPIHEHYLTEVEEKVFIYKYKPDSSLKETEYIDYLKKFFKRKYNALSVEQGTLQDFLRIK